MQKQFTQNELTEIKQLQADYQQLGLELVQTKLAISQLKEQLTAYEQSELKLVEKISEINKQEQKLVASLQERYGRGELDLATGLFTPNE